MLNYDISQFTSMFLLIAYRANSYDYCMGSEMERYESEHVVRDCENVDELINEVSNLMAQPCGRGQAEWEISIIQVRENLPSDFDAHMEAAVKQKIAERKESERQAQIRHEAAHRERERRNELEMLSRLLAKHGKPSGEGVKDKQE